MLFKYLRGASGSGGFLILALMVGGSFGAENSNSKSKSKSSQVATVKPVKNTGKEANVTAPGPGALSETLQDTPSFSSEGDKEKIAVLDFSNKGLPEHEASILSQEIKSLIFKTNKYIIVERTDLNSIMDEQGLQNSDMVELADKDAAAIGKILNVRKLILGSVGKIDGHLYVSLKMIDVSSAKIVENLSQNHTGSTQSFIQKSLPALVGRLTGVANLKVEYQNPDKWKIPMYTSFGTGLVLGALGAWFWVETDGVYDEYQERGQSTGYYKDKRDALESGEIKTLLTFSGSAAFMAGGGIF